MIILKSNREIEIMREAGTILYEVMNGLKEKVKEGVSANELDSYAEERINSFGATPAFKGYRGYPYTICVSVNDEVIHGFPVKEKIFKNGDLVSLDLGLMYKGYYSDMAYTVPVGDIDEEKKRLLEIGERILYAAISMAKVGMRVGNISSTIENLSKRYGYSVVKEFIGHGIGRKLHEEPEVPNFGSENSGAILKEGMTIAIEPMICMGSGEVFIDKDGWTVKTKDKMPSVHFEHTVAITKNGPLILTSPEEIR
ncbi:MAG: type I methionyl aminopeptidase [Caldisericia bacterium]|nr:type I methionyl aminopeptidase [Caldisericia bacterium]